MTDLNSIAQTNAAFGGLFPDAPALDAAQVRLRPADLARMLKVSRQAVSQWIAGGKLRLDADGRISAASAVRQLVQHHPERLRASALAPVVREMNDLRLRVAGLERDLATARADAEFHSGATGELIEQQAELLRQLLTWRETLAGMGGDIVVAAVCHWLTLFTDPAAPADPSTVRLVGIATTLRGSVKGEAGLSRPNTATNLEQP